jgi:hypothetical protein
MTAQRHEDMEPPDCNRRDDDWFCEQCGSLLRDDATDFCPDCQRERDEINGIYENGTEETATIRLAKFRTTDGRGTCMLDPAHDVLCCPMLRANAEGIPSCGWTGSELVNDNPDGSGYIRPCLNCPIHQSP